MLKFVINIVISLIVFVPLQAQQKYEVRATWLTTLGGMDWPSQPANSPQGIKQQQAELCQRLDELKAANFNTVLFQTRLRGDVIYPSYLESFSACLTGKLGKNPGYDPLQFAIDECHKRGLALHAWVVAFPIGSKRQVKLLGKKSVVAKRPSMCKLFNGKWYLDPGEPATSDYLSAIVKEIVARYDVDGIHFDYMRYPEHGKRFPDYRSYKKYGKDVKGKKIPLAQWRRENITRIVRRLYTEIKDIKPWVVVSSSPIGKYNDTNHYRSYGWNAYQEVNQEAQRWLKEGIHDALFPMMYFKDNHFFPFALDWRENKNGRWIVPGLGIYFLETKSKEWMLDDVIRQIYFTRDEQLDGQSYFRNQFLVKDVKGVNSELKKHFYTYPAVTPPLTWLDSIAPAPPVLISFGADKEGVTSIHWKASATPKRGGIHYRIYASNTYPVDVTDGRNIVSIAVSDSTLVSKAEFPWQQRLYWAITAVDRYGNESTPLSCNQQQPETLPIYDQQLPRINPGERLIISDVTGKKLFECSGATCDTVNQLLPGIYRISLLKPNGEKKLIGTLIR